VPSVATYEAKLLTAAIVGGVTAAACDRFFVHSIVAKLPLTRILEALVACGIFGVLYFGVAFLFGVPEVRAFLGRFIKRASV
jgi:hypothetical protein